MRSDPERPVHDMGGVRGFGRVDVERDEPVYHARWEGRVHGMMRRLLGVGRFNLDQFRLAVERIPRAEYLRSSYYERWLTALEELIRGPDPRSTQRLERHEDASFRVGDAVRTRNVQHAGHTRLPRYVAGKRGVVAAVHGPYRLPDTNAQLGEFSWEPVYTVAFDARELWGERAEAAASVRIDLWQSYLERSAP